jgi:hypothetical protein
MTHDLHNHDRAHVQGWTAQPASPRDEIIDAFLIPLAWETVNGNQKAAWPYAVVKPALHREGWIAYHRDAPFADPVKGGVAFFPTEADAIAACEADHRAEAVKTWDIAKIEALVGRPFPDETGFCGLIGDAMLEAEKAMRKFPQPNYVITKIAEEAGEVVKAAVHCAEGRETAENLRGEMKQLIAMLYRLWVEGDGVHGLPSVRLATIRGRT